ncbi:NAD(P)/FAD-dependent oxidoreductase [Candidatus Uhrbacteria bacterium]|jgi:NAD(P)H-nitrite reductase large subunit|nr:NAD(P)/FAD-dependent oxidoreductase [Candidatus Uhrbacteria bacterium]
MNYLIIGGGIAGTTTADELRKIDSDAAITIISNEKHPLYSRVILPHYITGKVPRERVFLKTTEWYTDNNIDLVFDEVVSLDTTTKTVTGSNSNYEYDKLLIAGGGIVNKLSFPGSEEILHFQTIDDADKILDLLVKHANDETKPRVGIIGGGFIAMEFAEFFGEENYETQIFLRKDRFFSGSFDDNCSQILENHLAKWQIKTHKHTEIESYVDGIAKLSDGTELELDAIAAGVGLSSNFQWAADAGIEVNKGIVCNEFLETNVPDVYTAGDCAEFFDTMSKQHVRIGNWMNALMQSRLLAKNMTGEKNAFELVSSYSTKVMGLDIVSIGVTNAAKADEIVERPSDDGHMLIFGKNGVAVGATLVNQTKERARITKLIKERTPISNI